MLYLRFLGLSMLGSLGAFAVKSNNGGVCRSDDDCVPIGGSLIGAELACEGPKKLWTYNFAKFELAKEFQPTDGCNLILQRLVPSGSVSRESTYCLQIFC
jgi:hypothetical protein